MSQDITNPMQSISYTNKDFETIYPELLDLVKELTNKWDPSISNESDPGVILLKLNAIIADKCNYNSDVNVLETFPLSVSQEQNARKLFEQLGYYMHWYRSATTDVSLAWTGTVNSELYYKIPAFTSVCDEAGTTIYTLIGPSDSSTDTELNVGYQYLHTDGTVIKFKAIEGLVNQFSLNNDTTITYNNLDYNNRLYFTNTNVAENGIFITNIDQNNFNDWQKKDNLNVEHISIDNKYYSFGLSQDNYTCYIQFPENAEELIGEGLNIYYALSSGADGNIGVNELEKFYVNIITEEDNSVTLSADNVKITNPSSAVNGINYETIDEAYKGYKSTVGTFDTLVTLRDYMNYIYNSTLISNGFVTDRNEDIQCTYKVMILDNDITVPYTVLESDTLTAFSLKLYLLQYNNSLESATNYLQTFNPTSNLTAVKAYIEDTKEISHDYADILTSNRQNPHICYFKNKYPIDVNIYTKYVMTTEQMADIKTNVRNALYAELNARQMTFGENVEADQIKTIILGADDRIKSIKFNKDITYTTYGVYTEDGSVYKEIQVSQEFENDGTLLDNAEDTLVYSSEDVTGFQINKTTFLTRILSETRAHLYSNYNFVYSNNTWSLTYDDETTSTTVSDLSIYGITYTSATTNAEINVKINNSQYFKEDIFAKSVLGGTSNLLIHDETFDYTLQQTETNIYENCKSIEPFLDFYLYDLSDTSSISTYDSTATYALNDKVKYSINGTYKYFICVVPITSAAGTFDFSKWREICSTLTLKENETLEVFSPALNVVTQYSNNVLYELYIKSSSGVIQNDEFPAGINYELKSGEYLVLYWKNSSSDSLYQYALYTQGIVINCTLAMGITAESSLLCKSELIDSGSTKWEDIGTVSHSVYQMKSETAGDMSATLSSQIATSYSSDSSHKLSTTRTVDIKLGNVIEIDNSNTHCYWYLRESTTIGGEDYFVLFDESESVGDVTKTKVLETGEYFFTTDDNLTDFVVYGAGTQIVCTIPSGVTERQLKVVALTDLSSILKNGVSEILDKWILIPSPITLTVGETIVNAYSTGDTITASCSLTGWNVRVTNNITDLTYTSGGTTSQIKINGIDSSYLSDYFGQKQIRALLNLTISNELEQQLLRSQYVNVVYVNSDVDTTALICGSDVIDGSLSGTYIQGSTDISTDGQKISLYNAYTEEYPQIYVYQKSPNVINSLVNKKIYNSDGTVSITYPTSGTTYFDIQFNLPDGDYLIPLQIPDMTSTVYTGSYVSITKNNVELPTIYDDTLTHFNTEGIYYIKLTLDSSTTTTIRVSYTHTNSAGLAIKLGNLFKYIKPEFLTTAMFNRILRRMTYLHQNHTYDYTYEVPEEDYIENPISASSFFKYSHIYNKYTIAQMNPLTNNFVLAGTK